MTRAVYDFATYSAKSLVRNGREEAIVEEARADLRVCRRAALELNFAARSDHDNFLEHSEQHEPLVFVKSPPGPITAVHIKEEVDWSDDDMVHRAPPAPLMVTWVDSSSLYSH